MNLKRAVVIAVHAIEKEIKLLAFDANMFDLCHVDEPDFRRAAERRRELQEAIEVLREKGREG
jgi:hypothetical protein